ncbi:hypothetical protein [Herbaspirillum sp. RV1423]|uniref:hypothetical protein n=1 Tax=Herbaspirillum sp. RV1423 TaxID=1443993 RepID=UPI0004B61E73|nr:hypothetical protein [Herbaspirillum sp. RV1423]
MMPMQTPQEIWRANFLYLLPELHIGERLLAQEWINKDILKYRVIWEGCRAIEKKLSSCLHEMDGMQGAW